VEVTGGVGQLIPVVCGHFIQSRNFKIVHENHKWVVSQGEASPQG